MDADQLFEKLKNGEATVSTNLPPGIMEDAAPVRFSPYTTNDTLCGKSMSMSATAYGRTLRLIVTGSDKFGVPGKPVIVMELFNRLFDKPSEIRNAAPNSYAMFGVEGQIPPDIDRVLKELLGRIIRVKPKFFSMVKNLSVMFMSENHALGDLVMKQAKDGPLSNPIRPLFATKKGVA